MVYALVSMALLDTLVLRLGVDDRMGGPLQMAERRVLRMRDRMASTATQLGGMARGAAALGAGLAAGLGLSVRAAMRQESAFAGVRKTVDATEERFAAMEENLRRMTQQIPLSAEELTKVAEIAGQLGVDESAIETFTETIAKLGITTDLAGEDAALALARFAQISQLPHDQVDRLGATIAELGNNSAAMESEILHMGTRLAGAGAIVGLTEAEVLGLSAALVSVGINAESGGTALSRVLLSMRTMVRGGGDELGILADVAGMEAPDFAALFEQDTAGALTKFITGLKAAEEGGVDVTGVLDALGWNSVRIRDALLRASGAGDLLGKSFSLATNAFAENTALDEETEKRVDTFESQLKMLRSAVEFVAVEIGGALMPAIRAVVERVRPVVMAVGDWVRANPALVRTIAAVAAGVTVFAGVLGVAAAGMAVLNLALALSPIGLIAIAIAGLVAGVAAAAAAIGMDAGKIGQAWDKLKEWIKPIAVAVKAFWQDTAVPAIKTAWQALKNGVAIIWAAVKAFWVKTAEPAIKVAWNALKGAIGTIWSEVKAFWEKTAEPVVKTAWSALKGWVETIVAEVKAFWVTTAVPVVKTAWAMLKGAIGTIWAEVKAFWEATAVPTVKAAWNALKTVVSTILANVKASWDALAVPIVEVAWGKLRDKVAATVAVFSPLWDSSAEVDTTRGIGRVKAAWEALKARWAEFTADVEEALKPLWEAWSEAADSWNDVLAALGVEVKATFETEEDGVVRPLARVTASLEALALILDVLRIVLTPLFWVLKGIMFVFTKVAEDLKWWYDRIAGLLGGRRKRINEGEELLDMEQEERDAWVANLARAGVTLDDPGAEQDIPDEWLSGVPLVRRNAAGELIVGGEPTQEPGSLAFTTFKVDEETGATVAEETTTVPGLPDPAQATEALPAPLPEETRAFIRARNEEAAREEAERLAAERWHAAQANMAAWLGLPLSGFDQLVGKLSDLDVESLTPTQAADFWGLLGEMDEAALPGELPPTLLTALLGRLDATMNPAHEALSTTTNTVANTRSSASRTVNVGTVEVHANSDDPRALGEGVATTIDGYFSDSDLDWDAAAYEADSDVER